MLRSFVLTWKIHRFEVVFCAIVLVLFAVGAWWVSSRMLDLDIPLTCWQRDDDGPYASAECDELMRRYHDIRYGDAGFVRVGLNLVAPIVGLILGVPIVARELELRTTSLAWSLSLRRSRWLFARFLPMVAVALVGFVILGWLGSRLFEAIAVGRDSPDLTEVAAHGPALVARGLMAMAIGLLAGALVGRTMPALLLAAVGVLAWALVAVPVVQGAMSQERGVWRSDQSEQWREGSSPITWVDWGEFDVSKPGLPGEPGARWTDEDWERLQGLIVERCGPAPEGSDDDDYDFSSPEWQAWSRCTEEYPPPSNLQWTKVVPASAYPDYQNAELLLDSAIAVICLLLTIPVVARRRPA